MNEYFTPPDSPAAGSRARSSLITQIIDAIDNAFDNIPVGLADSIDDLYDKWVDEIGLPALVNGEYLTSDGTDLLWSLPIPSQSGNAGKVLGTDGSSAAWELKYPSQSGKAGYTLKTDGTDPVWEYVPSFGQIEATASGSCTAGVVAVLNSDGTVSEADSGTGYSETPVTFESGRAYNLSSCHDSTNDVIVFAYEDNNDSNKGKAVVGTISGGVISFGTTAEFESGEVDYVDCCYDSTNEKVVVCYRDEDDSDNGKAVVGTVSGTSISFGTPVTFNAAATSYITCSFDATNGKVVVAYNDTSGKGIVGTVSGSTISFGAEAEFYPSSVLDCCSCYDPDYGKIIIAFTASSTPYAIVGAVSGTDITFEGQEDFLDTDFSSVLGCAYDTDNDKVFVALRYGTSLKGVVLNVVSGTGFSVGDITPISLIYNASDDACVCFDSTISQVVVFYKSAPTGYLAVIPATITGTDVVPGTGVTILSEGVFDVSCDYVSGVSVVGFYRGVTGDSPAIIYDFTSTTYDWLGIFSETVSDGETVNVTVVGGVDDNQSGLTPGQTYYIDVDGDIVDTATSYGEIGRALTASTILITKGGYE